MKNQQTINVVFQYHLDRWSLIGSAQVDFGAQAEVDEFGNPTEGDTPDSVEISALRLGSHPINYDLLPATLRKELLDAAYEKAVDAAEIRADRMAYQD